MRMDNLTQDTAKEPAKDLSKLNGVDIEAFAQNLARMVEEGGKALAAYLKPREEGKIKSEIAEDVTDVVKTIVFVTDLSGYAAVNEAYAAFFGDHRPARSVVGVAALPMGAEVEVEVWAYRGP